MSMGKGKIMSVCATVWAWSISKDKVTASEKIVLLTMADRADEHHECFPSKERLAADTCLDRKTVFSSLDSLINKGLIKRTGKKRGRLKNIDVYKLIGVLGREKKSKLISTENGTDKDLISPKNGTLNSPENGTVNCTENGIQNLSVEPIIRTLTTTTEDTVVVVVLNSKKITTQLQNAFRSNPVETDNIKNENDFLCACEYSILHRNDGNTGKFIEEMQRVRGIIKLVKENRFDDPPGWFTRTKSNIIRHKNPFTKDEMEIIGAMRSAIDFNTIESYFPNIDKRRNAKLLFEKHNEWMKSCAPNPSKITRTQKALNC